MNLSTSVDTFVIRLGVLLEGVDDVPDQHACADDAPKIESKTHKLRSWTTQMAVKSQAWRGVRGAVRLRDGSWVEP